jgi:hypothetical protein
MTERFFRIAIIVAVAASCGAFFVCTKESNPFNDPANSRVIIKSKTFANADTIDIFSTETLVAVVAVREHVDSFSVIAEHNRRAPDTLTRGGALPLTAAPYTFLFSFIDTGRQTILINTYRNNGENVSQEFYVTCRTPLRQATLSGLFGDSITVATRPVRDLDVHYHWDFGGGNVVSSQKCSTIAVVKLTPSFRQPGMLWVSDLSDSNESPKAPFTCTWQDNKGPLIEVNGISSGDTIQTADSLFYFMTKIYDPAQLEKVTEATINNDTFSLVQVPYYIKIFRNISYAGCFKVKIRAVDNSTFGNVTIDSFFIKYNPAAPPTNTATLEMIFPSKDALSTMSRDQVLLGQIKDFSRDSVKAIVKMWINGKASDKLDTVSGKGSGFFTFTISLPQDTNRITLVAVSLSGDTIGKKSLQILYDPTVKDTEPPVIVDVAVNAKSQEKSTPFFTDRDSAAFKVIAYDKVSGVQSVSVNGQNLLQAAEGDGLVWIGTIKPIDHSFTGNRMIITATDKVNKQSHDTVFVYKNNLPRVLWGPKSDTAILTGTAYIDSLVCQDIDNDTLSVEMKSNPGGLTLQKTSPVSWRLAWIPTIPDVGKQFVVSMIISDRFQETTYSFTLGAHQSTITPPSQVRFITTEKDFPMYLEVNKDSLNLQLITTTDPKNEPLHFSAGLRNNNNKTLTVNSNKTLQWKPVLADTGFQQLVVTVTDAYSRSDSLFSRIAVVPPNRPCSLEVTYDIFSVGSNLYLTNATQPETLHFSINDPDPAIAENHTVRIVMGKTETINRLDSTRTFLVILDPKSFPVGTRDTLRVSVTDRAGHADTLVYVVVYGLISRITMNTGAGGIQITSDLKNFPLLVRLDNSNFHFAEAKRHGEDIRFKKPDGTRLPFEIERWDSLEGRAELWVKVDTIHPFDNTQYIIMSWGDRNAIDSSNGHSVFDTANAYMGVWHLNEGGTVQRKNSAQPLYNCDPQNFNATSSSLGVVAHADSFSLNNYLSTQAFPSPTAFTMSCWVYLTSYKQFSKILSKAWDNYNAPFECFSLELNGYPPSPVMFRVGFQQGGPGAEGLVTGKTQLQLNKWTYLTVTYDQTTLSLYFNGVLDNSTVVSGQIHQNNRSLHIGTYELITDQRISGNVDEVRILKSPSQIDFIRLSYENQKPGSTFVTIK